MSAGETRWYKDSVSRLWRQRARFKSWLHSCGAYDILFSLSEPPFLICEAGVILPAVTLPGIVVRRAGVHVKVAPTRVQYGSHHDGDTRGLG